MEDKIKVVWICGFSNLKIRDHLQFEKYTLNILLRKLFKKNCNVSDYGVWNTNAIKEFENFNDIELHVISRHKFLSKKVQAFKLNNIYYHFYKPEDESICAGIRKKIQRNKYYSSYDKNSRIINEIINQINPDIVHLIGAENPQYSSSVLQLDKKYPLLVSLQTLMADPEFYNNYPISKEIYDYRCRIEASVLKKATYICTIGKKFQDIILNEISSEAKFLKIKLAVGEEINKCNNQTNKSFDFVYFALNINKAADYAIESFAIAHQRHNGITLNIVGEYDLSYKEKLDKRIKELGIENNVFFSGKLPLHEDVLMQIQKSKVALLPLKIDIISGTIREAMANGIPVVTTITPGTPLLNKDRKSVLLSPIGDHNAMANNMIRVLKDEILAKELIQNSFITVSERYDNKKAMSDWFRAYRAIFYNIKDNTPIPNDLLA
ncbi:MAG: glycosyltransferase family 4 protein [Bacteroides sp]|nr:glycosyltransferase family 4 protein [Bacteroides sp.]